MGSATAWQLARRGRRVLGLEQFTPAHDRGSSHGRTRVIRQAYFEHPSYVPLLLRAYELWHEAERESGRELLTLCGGLMMGRPDSEVVTGSVRSAQEHCLSHELLDAAEIRRRYPPFRISDDTVALFEAKAGLVHTERAVQTHLDLAIRAGAELHFEEPALSWRATSGGGVEVTTRRTTYLADRLVITAGPWAPQVLCDLNLSLVVERQVLFWFQPPGGVPPYLPGHFPIYVYERPDGLQPYGFPATDGLHGGVKIAWFRTPLVETGAPETLAREVRVTDEASIRQAVRDLLPGLDGERVHAETCLYTCTPDLNFVLGRHPEFPQVALAAGFSGHGFKFCSIIGEVMADLAEHGRTAHDLSLFALDRFCR